MTESELAKAIIEQADDRFQFDVEVHYNHYGTRGCVDLVRIDSYDIGTVYELKSDAALDEATGANEIIRQFKRHCRYFTRGTDQYSRRINFDYVLCFNATDRGIRHIRGNSDLYLSALDGISATVGVFHEETGFVPIVDDTIWNEDVDAQRLREVVDLTM